MILLNKLAEHLIRVGDTSIQKNVREEMAKIGRNLPHFAYKALQQFFTWITGKALNEQTPYFLLGAWSHALLNALVFLAGMLISYASFSLGEWWLFFMPIGWILTTHAARKQFLVICHAGIHDAFSKRLWVNKLFVDLSSLFIFTMPYHSFKQDHSINHHAKYFTGKGDPDAEVLHNWVGLTKEKSLAGLYLSVAYALISPMFHVKYIIARAKANFITADTWRILSAVIFYSTTIYFIFLYDLLSFFFIAWFIPVIFGFQNTALVTFAGEHKWFNSQKDNESKFEWMQRQTAARFMGEPPPRGNSSF